jgi:hypothetical protein
VQAWNDLASKPQDIPITAEQAAEVERRSQEYRKIQILRLSISKIPAVKQFSHTRCRGSVIDSLHRADHFKASFGCVAKFALVHSACDSQAVKKFSLPEKKGYGGDL